MKMEYVEEVDLLDEETYNPEKVERIALEKIHQGHRRRPKRIIFLAAALVVILGTCTFGISKGWDSHLAEFIGLTEYQEELTGGYVEIGQEKEDNGIRISVVRSIGDNNSQWIQMDTNLDFAEQGYYELGMDTMVHVYWKDKFVGGGDSIGQYDNDGKLSFIVYLNSYEKLNRSKVEIDIEDISYYADIEDEKPAKTYDCSFHFSWENNYRDNTKTIDTGNRHVTITGEEGNTYGATIRKIEISPVTLKITGKVKGKCAQDYIYIDSIRMKDGTEYVSHHDFSTTERKGIWHLNMRAVTYISLMSDEEDSWLGEHNVNGMDIQEVVIGGKVFAIP